MQTIKEKSSPQIQKIFQITQEDCQRKISIKYDNEQKPQAANIAQQKTEDMKCMKNQYDKKQKKLNKKVLKGLAQQIYNSQEYQEYLKKELWNLSQFSAYFKLINLEDQNNFMLSQKFKLYQYLKQQARDFQLNSFQISALSIYLERKGLNDYIQNHTLIIPISALIIYQLFSSYSLETHQIYQELINFGGFSVLFNWYIYGLINQKEVIQIRNHQINHKFKQIVSLSKEFKEQKLDSKMKLFYLNSYQIQKEYMTEISDKIDFSTIYFKKEINNDFIWKIINRSEIQEVIQAIQRSNKIAFVNMKNPANLVQWIPQKQFDKNILLSRQDEQVAKNLVKQILTLANSGVISASILKEYRMYFPTESCDSSDIIKKNKEALLDYQQNNHLDEVLAIDLKLLQEMQQMLNNLNKTYDRKSSAIQTLSYKLVILLAQQSLLQENQYKSSCEKVSDNESEESLNELWQKPSKQIIQENKEISQLLKMQIVMLPNKQEQFLIESLQKITFFQDQDQQDQQKEKLLLKITSALTDQNQNTMDTSDIQQYIEQVQKAQTKASNLFTQFQKIYECQQSINEIVYTFLQKKIQNVSKTYYNYCQNYKDGIQSLSNYITGEASNL